MVAIMDDDDDMFLDQRIRDETSKIKVDSYQKAASLGGWAGSGRTLWAISAIALVAGASVGLVAPFFPILAGVSSLATALSAVPASVAAFGATGMSMGFVSGLMLGRISGSGAAVAEESERRMKAWTTRQLLSANPQMEIQEDPEKEKPAKKPFKKRAQEGYQTYINPRVGLVFAALGAVGGLVMAAAFLSTGGVIGAVMPALGTLTGLGAAASAPAAVVSYTVGVMATFGAMWALNLPKITSATTEFFGKLTSGKLLGREWGPQAVNPEPARPLTVPVPEQELVKPQVRQFGSFTELVSRQEAERSINPTLSK